MLHFWFADTVIVPIIQIAIFCTWPVKLSTIFISSLGMTVQVNIRVQVIIIHHWVFWALKIICIYSYIYYMFLHKDFDTSITCIYIYLFIPSQRHGLAYLNFTHCTCSNCSCTSAYDWWVSILAYALFFICKCMFSFIRGLLYNWNFASRFWYFISGLHYCVR